LQEKKVGIGEWGQYNRSFIKSYLNWHGGLDVLKRVPKLTGEVLSVSADILLDEATGEQYFLARIKIDEDEINHLKAKITLYPGMPAQAFIITGTRSLFKYLFDPITEASYKAFRED